MTSPPDEAIAIDAEPRRSRVRMPRRYRWALALSLAVLLAQAVGVPALTDPLGAPVPDDWRLDTPFWYGVLAPVFSLWDQVSMLSRSRLSGLLLGLLLIHGGVRWMARGSRQEPLHRAVLRETAWAGGALVMFALFVMIGMRWNTRPARRLVGLAVEEFTLEIHSHTNASHDVRSWPVAGFGIEQARRWHQRAGVDVLFVTDHNVTRGWGSLGPGAAQGETIICPGIEISAFGAHVLVLGTPLPLDPLAYRGTTENRARLFQETAASPGIIAIASLPEYRGKASEFLAEGVGGFEIVNASPKANEISRAERDSVVALAARHGLTVVAAGDQHGYGATPMAWNVMSHADWRRVGSALCGVIVSRLRTGGPRGVRIVERARLRPDHPLPGFLTPFGVIWMAWATLTLAGVVSWLAWIWASTIGVGYASHRLREHRARAILTTVGRFHIPSDGD